MNIKALKSVPLPVNKEHTQTVKRNQNLQRIRTTLKEVPIFKKNIILNKKRISECRSTFIDQQLDLSPCFSPMNGKKCQEHFQPVQLFECRYQLLEKIGQGSNGLVRKCKNKQNGQIYAVKSFTFEDEHIPNIKANFLMMKRLRHPNIVRYESLFIDMKKRIAWLVMEYLSFPSLERAEIKDEECIRKIMFQIMETLNYLHRLDTVHRDIKLSNVLYDPRNKIIKVVDFGISKRFRKRDALIEMWTVTGTLFYRAPEMFEGEGYRESVDIWAAGVLLYKMVAGKTPFQSEYHSQTIQNIRKAELTFGSIFEKYSVQLRKFISRLLSRNPEERPTALTCMRDPWLSCLYARCKGTTTGKQNEKTFTKETNGVRQTPKFEMSMSIKESNDELVNTNPLVKLSSIRSTKYNSSQYHCIEEIQIK